MKAIIFLTAIALSGCLHDKSFKESLYCDDVLIVVGDTGVSYWDTKYFYYVDNQEYTYSPIQGSVCKVVKVN